MKLALWFFGICFLLAAISMAVFPRNASTVKAADPSVTAFDKAAFAFVRAVALRDNNQVACADQQKQNQAALDQAVQTLQSACKGKVEGIPQLQPVCK